LALDHVQVDGLPEKTATGWRPGVVLHALFFVLGFTVVFSFIGASVGLVGYLVQDALRWINLVAGMLLMLFGIHVTGVFRIAALWLVRIDQRGRLPAPLRSVSKVMYRLVEVLYAEKRLDYRPSRRGVASSFGVGMAFAVGWTPCVGFVLGGILSAAFNTSEATGALFLLMAYSLGLGIPFLLAAAFFDRARGMIRAMQRHSTAVNLVSGAGLIAFGLLIALDFTPRLSALLGVVPVVDDAFLTTGLGRSLGVGWAVPAFVAGVLSFVSPCVLPLVPVYLAHLAGTATAIDGAQTR
jgi:cytochrome c-type biogenesis protein